MAQRTAGSSTTSGTSSDLASDPSAPKERSLRASIEGVRRREPSFVAQYNGVYFSL